MLYGVSTDLYTHPVLELLEHGDVRNTLSLLAVNTLVLVGRLFERIPKGITNSAYASLKWIGLLALPECGHQFRKEIEHGLSSLRENSPALTAHFAFKAIRIGLSLYFIAVGVTAAVSALFSYTQIEIALYRALGRFGGLSILVTVVDVVWTALRVQ
ncbi:MAG: hypothetical protein KDK40_03735, partial [Chlamydiia bacterium]|nr:hypothetical protein [Chlamydiia bacterium]